MHFPKYWAKGAWSGADRNGRLVTREVWGWSDTSAADARNRAQARAQQLGARALPDSDEAGDYPYPHTPLREPVLRTVPTNSSDVRAIITRNGYGCEVLNTDRVLFIDVDLPPPRPKGFFAALFGRAKDREEARIAAEAEKIALLEQWQRNYPALAFRVYRTAAGLRYLLTSALAAPEAPIAEDAFKHLSVDPEYRLLCQQQKSFRARLTPKPWRCGVARPPCRFPFADAGHAERFQAWLQSYEPVARQHAVCLHLLTIGSAPTAPEIAPIVAEHDRVSGVGTTRPLA